MDRRSTTGTGSMAVVQSSLNAFRVQRRRLASTANPRFPTLHPPPPSPRCIEAWLPKPRSQTPHGLRRGLCLASLPSSSALGGGARLQGVREGVGPVRARVDVSSSLGDEEPRPAGIEAARSGAAWIHRYLPAWVRPYALLARLDRPVGIWLFFWPCAWSLTMAANPGELPDAKLLALFFILSVFIRGAACTVNDYLDRDIDRKVERSKNRPLASGLLSPFQGICFFWFQVLVSAGTFVLLNSCSRILGAFLLPLLSSYPLMKRFIYWPQGYLGFGANGGALLGWAAVKGSLEPAITLPLYVAGIFWTLLYDTIYAHQDKEDDIKAGVKSTAVKFGSSSKHWITGFGIACIGALALSGYNANLAWPYYPFLAIAAAHMAWQVVTVDLSNGPDCDSKFISNEWFGALVFLGVLFGRLGV